MTHGDYIERHRHPMRTLHSINRLRSFATPLGKNYILVILLREAPIVLKNCVKCTPFIYSTTSWEILFAEYNMSCIDYKKVKKTKKSSFNSYPCKPPICSFQKLTWDLWLKRYFQFLFTYCPPRMDADLSVANIQF